MRLSDIDEYLVFIFPYLKFAMKNYFRVLFHLIFILFSLHLRKEVYASMKKLVSLYMGFVRCSSGEGIWIIGTYSLDNILVSTGSYWEVSSGFLGCFPLGYFIGVPIVSLLSGILPKWNTTYKQSKEENCIHT
jgi:hypothetical protein